MALNTDTSGDDAMADTLKQRVGARFVHYKCPRRIEFLRARPNTASARIQRFKRPRGQAPVPSRAGLYPTHGQPTIARRRVPRPAPQSLR